MQAGTGNGKPRFERMVDFGDGVDYFLGRLWSGYYEDVYRKSATRRIEMSEVVVNLSIEALPEGGYLATSEDLPGLVAQGRTLAEVLEIAQDVARKLVESYQEHGDPLPETLQEGVPARLKVAIPVGVA